jgi:hypothetical protein
MEAKEKTKVCECGDAECVIEFKTDDAAEWMEQVRRAEESVRGWLRGLEAGVWR